MFDAGRAGDLSAAHRATGTTGGVWLAPAESPLGPYDLAGAQQLTDTLQRRWGIHVRPRFVADEFECIRVTPDVFTKLDEVDLGARRVRSRSTRPLHDLALYYLPYAYLTVAAALRNMDPAMEEAAYLNGDFGIDGRLPVNTDGGLLANGTVPPQNLTWGYSGGGLYAQRTSDVEAGAFQMPGTFLRGDQIPKDLTMSFRRDGLNHAFRQQLHLRQISLERLLRLQYLARPQRHP